MIRNVNLCAGVTVSVRGVVSTFDALLPRTFLVTVSLKVMAPFELARVDISRLCFRVLGVSMVRRIEARSVQFPLVRVVFNGVVTLKLATDCC